MSWNNRLSGVSLAPIPNLDLIKGKVKKEDPSSAMRSFTENPLDVQSQMGYKDRRYSNSFEILKRIPGQLATVAGIIQTRCNQVATFAQPFRENQGIGFRITHKDKHRDTTRGEAEFIRSLENFIRACGQPAHNKYSNFKRDNFEAFLKKFVRDSLIYDQCVAEIVPDKKGGVYEFMAVDASTIRIAAPFYDNKARDRHQQSIIVAPKNSAGEKSYTTLSMQVPFNERPAYVQLIDGKVENVYSRDEMAFCIRNPRTDLQVMGYGYSELEMLITTITSHLNAEAYNSLFFKQNSTPRGLINFKGDEMSEAQLEGFRRMWRNNMEGVQNSWKTPITQSAAGVEWINMQSSNRDMEYGKWLDYLIRCTCTVYQIDPAELNFDLNGAVQQAPGFESSQEWKLKASRDKGLRPLLRFVADQINENIIKRIDDSYVFEFIGLDEPTEKEKHDLRKEQMSSYLTLNEVRQMDDRPSLPNGDMPMNPTYLQAITLKMQQDQAAQQAAAGPAPGATPGQAPAAGQGAGAAADGTEEAAADDSDDHIPEYSDSFGQ